MMDKRIQNEINHGKYLKDLNLGEIWYWETPAGKHRFQRRVQMLSSNIKSNMNVLEVGCGIGLFTKEIARTESKVTAIDISEDLLEIARKKVIASNEIFKIENAYELAFPDNFFDTIVGSSVLHHLEIEKAIKEFYRVLKPEGGIFFTEPNMLNPQIILERNIGAIRKWLHNSPDETAFIRWLLKKQFKKYGFQNIQIIPFDFLHPAVPPFLIPLVKNIGKFLETIPILNEIAGSLYITAEK